MTRFTSIRTSLVLAALLAPSPALADGVVTAFGTSVLIASGSPPALSGTCTTSTQVGGQAAGSFHATCTVGQTVIMTFATTAPNGWACKTSDQTTPADALNQTASTTTTATFTGTATGAGDVISFMCMGY